MREKVREGEITIYRLRLAGVELAARNGDKGDLGDLLDLGTEESANDIGLGGEDEVRAYTDVSHELKLDVEEEFKGSRAHRRAA